MKKLILITAVMGLAGCSASSDIIYNPAEQKLPIYIKRIAVRPFANKTQQFGLEEKITLKVIDEFLKNGEYAVSPEASAQGVIVGEISHYILTPIQYDVNLVPTVYKLNVIAGLRLLDREQNRYLWEEPALQVTKVYSAANLPGGLTEEQAREALWEILAKDVVLRTVSGFGSVSSASQKKLPGAQDNKQPPGGVNPNP
ncbi:MAG: hypothetical protein COX65_10535 [Elusimicrobia bacterium CG_4_10_14_0_2_um_filter_56_8]|nr:MAG: hypothetical protein AUJ51_05360 [Elusimicrobia bacterium CG1_02_56_21]PJA11424.1 MAG: hypothetical protein COX65_10535 [Elusimicrobia bacterium CG_4_10_14_0_2_um_filter_56_8]